MSDNKKKWPIIIRNKPRNIFPIHSLIDVLNIDETTNEPYQENELESNTRIFSLESGQLWVDIGISLGDQVEAGQLDVEMVGQTHVGATDDNEAADDNEVESNINSDENLECVDKIQTANIDLIVEDDDDDDWL